MGIFMKQGYSVENVFFDYDDNLICVHNYDEINLVINTPTGYGYLNYYKNIFLIGIWKIKSLKHEKTK